ncbi:hypothetical protein BC829DRAFT_229026 [Chytridium lagenaria]|nr:hypothetical protein BC829DRAFT_229026 [Chytridium lagenaria]
MTMSVIWLVDAVMAAMAPVMSPVRGGKKGGGLEAGGEIDVIALCVEGVTEVLKAARSFDALSASKLNEGDVLSVVNVVVERLVPLLPRLLRRRGGGRKETEDEGVEDKDIRVVVLDCLLEVAQVMALTDAPDVCRCLKALLDVPLLDAVVGLFGIGVQDSPMTLDQEGHVECDETFVLIRQRAIEVVCMIINLKSPSSTTISTKIDLSLRETKILLLNTLTHSISSNPTAGAGILTAILSTCTTPTQPFSPHPFTLLHILTHWSPATVSTILKDRWWLTIRWLLRTSRRKERTVKDRGIAALLAAVLMPVRDPGPMCGKGTPGIAKSVEKTLKEVMGDVGMVNEGGGC